MVADPVGPQSNDLKKVVDTIVAPKEAFASIQATPAFAIPFLVLVFLVIIGFFLQRPAQLHTSVAVMQHMAATNPFFHSMDDQQKQQALHNAAHPPLWQAAIGLIMLVIGSLFAIFLNALFLLATNAVGSGKGNFQTFWSGSTLIAVPTLGLSSVVLGIITLLRGADAFSTMGDLTGALPNLGMLAPFASGLFGNTLGSISIFSLWGLALNLLLLRSAGVSKVLAWVVPIAITLGGALIMGAMAHLYGG